MDFLILAQQCAPGIEQRLVTRLMRQESSFNPYAIGLDGNAAYKPQPNSYEQAVEVAEKLIKEGQTFSVGIAQIHISNVRSFGLTWRQAFHACTNLSYGQQIFLDFHKKALAAGLQGDAAVYAALRGYNSGSIYAAVSNRYANSIMGQGSAAGAAAPQRKGRAATAEPSASSYRESWAESPTVRSDGQSKEFFEE
jgi:type IV secretion system protein VirB1